jgi:hypothetical protein
MFRRRPLQRIPLVLTVRSLLRLGLVGVSGQ